MEYCSNGDLLSYVTDVGFKNEQEKKRIIYEFLDSIKYLHKKGISHGDIKSENILLDSSYSTKLCDFGFCRTKPIVGDESKKGTFYYAAPELFAHGAFDPKKADIWAIGITLYSILELRLPFKDGKQEFVIKQIMSGCLTISESLDEKIRRVVEDCTKMKASLRPTIDDILRYDYFKEFHVEKKIRKSYESKTNVASSHRSGKFTVARKSVIEWKPKHKFCL